MRNARVFISCGQRDKREINIGKAVWEYFKNRDFEAYFAERVHSPEGLTEHIFSNLKESEYFVFIDFKRERLSKSKCKHRGSLFVSQEIAIATFLKISGLGFCENGIKREGILNYQIMNAFPFAKDSEIIAKLQEETKDWDKTSVNELNIIYNAAHDSKNYVITNRPGERGDWWHIEVNNRHKTKHAFSCLAYLSKVHNVDSGEQIYVPSIELLWSGLGVHSVNIWANDQRELDAFYVIHKDNKVCFTSRPVTTTNPRYNLPQLQNGRYKLEYSVISANFPTVSKQYLLDFSGLREQITFTPLE